MKMGQMRLLCSDSEKSPVTLSWLRTFLLCLFKVSGSRPPAVLPSPLPYFSRCPLVPPTLLRLFQKLFSFALYSELAFGLTHGLCTGSSWPETCLHLFCPFQPSTAEFVLPEGELSHTSCYSLTGAWLPLTGRHRDHNSSSVTSSSTFIWNIPKSLLFISPRLEQKSYQCSFLTPMFLIYRNLPSRYFPKRY